MNRDIQGSICVRHEQPVYDICENIVLYRNRYSNIQNTYRNSIRCYIRIISCILTGSYQINKMEYRLHVFIESLCNNIQESYPKNIKENFVLHSPIFIWNTGEYGEKKKKKRI